MGAMQGEACAFCGTDMKEGFTVCSGCGARRKEARPLRALLASLMVFVLVIVLHSLSVVIGLLPESAAESTLGAMITWVAAVAVYFMFPKKVVYQRRRE